MSIKKIYLAGGMEKFGHKNFEESNNWRLYLKNALENISDTYKVICVNPNDHFNFKEKGYESSREVMDYDLYRVKESNLIIVNFNDPNSKGTMAEIAIAYEKRIPVIGLCETSVELHPWQYNMCNRIFDNIEELILYVAKHYLTD